MEFLFLILGVLIGGVILYFYLRPKLKQTQEFDKETLQKNQDLHNELLELTKEHSSLIAKKEEMISNIATLQKQSEESSNAIYEKSYELANEKMNQAAEVLSKKYRDLETAAKDSYCKMLEEATASFNIALTEKQLEIEQKESILSDLVSKLNAAVEAAKRAEELKTKTDFYRLQLSQADLDEIIRLREVTPYLRDSEPLNKVIWKCYYEKPYTDLIGRVLGTIPHTGIYKITNIENQMCYVGQAANIADRWKQHIKRGIGAEAPTRNKLYPAMLKIGVENFTFELIEECDRALLNDREDYWQEYFHAKDFGYSIK